jgi:hypothetical protein
MGIAIFSPMRWLTERVPTSIANEGVTDCSPALQVSSQPEPIVAIRVAKIDVRSVVIALVLEKRFESFSETGLQLRRNCLPTITGRYIADVVVNRSEFEGEQSNPSDR